MGAPSKSGESFEPSIAGFFCQKCEKSSRLDHGAQNGEHLPGLVSVRLICAEKVGPDLIRQAFKHGADGVLVCGCLVGNCETLDGNAEVLNHIHQAKAVLREMGLAQGRLRREWICDPERDRVPEIVADFRNQLQRLGPLMVSEPKNNESRV